MIRWHDEDGDHEPDEDEQGTARVIRYLYDQEDILATLSDTGRELARYTHGPGIDEPLAEVRKHRTRFYHADTLGSIIALSEKHGHAVREYRYSAFGLPEDHRGDPQPYRYTGREWDKEVGLYFYRTRYYAARAGRFVQEDPLGLAAGINVYSYVNGRPLIFSDPFGLQAAYAGWATYYNLPGRKTASGQPFDASAMAAAMTAEKVTLGQTVTVEYESRTGDKGPTTRTISVIVNDRGPFERGPDNKPLTK